MKPVKIWFQRNVSRNTFIKGKFVASITSGDLALFSTEGRTFFREKVEGTATAATVKTGLSAEGHIQMGSLVKRFTRKGISGKTVAETDSHRLVDEDSRHLLFIGPESALLFNKNTGSGIEMPGYFSRGRLIDRVQLISQGLEIYDFQGKLEAKIPDVTDFVFGEENLVIGRGIFKMAKDKASKAFSPEGMSGKWAGFKEGFLTTGEGEAILYSPEGKKVWSGNIPGQLMGCNDQGPFFHHEGILTHYAFISEGMETYFEILCRNRQHCGTFVSFVPRENCPSCNGPDLVVRRSVVPEDFAEELG